MRSTPAKAACSGSRSRTTRRPGPARQTAHTDTYYGRFVKVVPNEQVVEVVEFKTTDSALRGEMTITLSLADADGGTNVLAVHDGLPRGLSTADNEAGWQSSLAKLASLVEGARTRDLAPLRCSSGGS